jgi:hypothetical protein
VRADQGRQARLVAVIEADFFTFEFQYSNVCILKAALALILSKAAAGFPAAAFHAF